MISDGGDPSLSSDNGKSSELDHIATTVSNQLHLKASPKTSSQALDKHLVLRRIRQRKTLNKLKTALHSLLPSSQPLQQDDNDAFSAP